MKVYEYFSSFFNEKIIETFPSQYNPELVVALINGRYELNAGSVNYSFGPLHDAFRRYFKKDPPQLTGQSSILVLGFGAGSVASILREELQLNNPITGVEIDPMVIKAGRLHFSLDKVQNLEIVESDALDFVQNCDEKYDLIVIDLYVDDEVPGKFQTSEFVNLVSRCLVKGGKVVFNKLISREGHNASMKELLGHFQQVFDIVEIITIRANKESPNCFITGILNE